VPPKHYKGKTAAHSGLLIPGDVDIHDWTIRFAHKVKLVFSGAWRHIDEQFLGEFGLGVGCGDGGGARGGGGFDGRHGRREERGLVVEGKEENL